MKRGLSKFFILIQTVIFITVFLLVSACDKKEEYTPYVEGSSFELKSYSALKIPSALNQIELEEGTSIEDVDFDSKKIILQKNDKYALMDFDGKYIYDFSCDLIQKFFGGYNVYVGNKTYIDIFTKNIHLDFDGFASLLYNGLIAYYPISEIRVDIMNTNKKVLYPIFDENRTNNITNYGKYLIYENATFGVYQVYDEYGNNVYECENTTRNELYYIYSDKLLYVGVTAYNGADIWTNKVIDITTKEQLPTFRSIIYTVSNKGLGNVNVSDGYSLLGTDEGFLYSNSDFSDIYPLYSSSTALIDEYATYYNVQSGSLYVINDKLKTILEIGSVYDFSANGEYISLAKGVNGSIKYGIITTSGETVFDYTFDYVSTVVGDRAIAYNTDENGNKEYFILQTDKTFSKSDLKISAFEGGIVSYIENDCLYVYNYKAELLLQKENAYIEHIDVFYGNSSYLTVKDSNGKIFLYTFVY